MCETNRSQILIAMIRLMAIGVEERSIKVTLDRMVQQVQQAMMKQYALCGVSKTLCDELGCSMIAQSNDHFIVLLPEVTPEELPGLIARLRRAVSEQVGGHLANWRSISPPRCPDL
jgi:hypothetical protein